MDSCKPDHDEPMEFIVFTQEDSDYPDSKVSDGNLLNFYQPILGISQNRSDQMPYQVEPSSQPVQDFHPAESAQQIAEDQQIILTDKEKSIIKFAFFSNKYMIVSLYYRILALEFNSNETIIIGGLINNQLFTFFGAIFGLVSVKRFNKYLAIIYIVHLFLFMIDRLLLMIFFPNLPDIIVFSLVIIYNGTASGILIAFVRKIYKSEQTELDRCIRFRQALL